MGRCLVTGLVQLVRLRLLIPSGIVSYLVVVRAVPRELLQPEPDAAVRHDAGGEGVKSVDHQRPNGYQLQRGSRTAQASALSNYMGL